MLTLVEFYERVALVGGLGCGVGAVDILISHQRRITQHGLRVQRLRKLRFLVSGRLLLHNYLLDAGETVWRQRALRLGRLLA